MAARLTPSLTGPGVLSRPRADTTPRQCTQAVEERIVVQHGQLLWGARPGDSRMGNWGAGRGNAKLFMGAAGC